MNYKKGDRVRLTMTPISSGIPGKPSTLTLHGEVLSVTKGIVEVRWDREVGLYYYAESDPDLKVVER